MTPNAPRRYRTGNGQRCRIRKPTKFVIKRIVLRQNLVILVKFGEITPSLAKRQRDVASPSRCNFVKITILDIGRSNVTLLRPKNLQLNLNGAFWNYLIFHQNWLNSKILSPKIRIKRPRDGMVRNIRRHCNQRKPTIDGLKLGLVELNCKNRKTTNCDQIIAKAMGIILEKEVGRATSFQKAHSQFVSSF